MTILDAVNMLLGYTQCSITCVKGLKIRNNDQFQRLTDALKTNTSIYELGLSLTNVPPTVLDKSSIRKLSIRVGSKSVTIMSSVATDFNWIRLTFLIASMRANQGHVLLDSLLACTSLVTKQLGFH